MRKQQRQTYSSEAATKRFLIRAMLLALLAVPVVFSVYLYLGSQAELEVRLSRCSNYTTRVENFIVVENAEGFPEIVTFKMSRWQAWHFDRRKPIFILDKNTDEASLDFSRRQMLLRLCD